MQGPMSSCGTQRIRLAADYANFLAPRSRLDQITTKRIPRPITSQNASVNPSSSSTLTPNHFPRRAMHHGCAARARWTWGGSGGVVADIAKLSMGREEYYTRELATDHAAYLSGHGESPGRWYGAAATSLGLQGEASVAEFQAMFEGRHPDTDELLGRPHGRGAVPAFDVVLRPTKSVSILYGLGDPAI